MTAWIAAARRHPGLSFVALPCAVVVLLVLALWPAPHTTGQPLPASAAGVTLLAQDRPAPDFSQPLLTGGGEVSLRQLRGRVVVVNFWASWCTACQRELPQLRALAHQLNRVVFLGVDEHDTRSGGRAVVQRLQLDYGSVFDANGNVLRAFGSIGVPCTYIVDRTGRIRYQAFGAVDPTALGTAVARVAR